MRISSYNLVTRPAGRLVLADIMAPERNSFGLVRLMLALAVLVSHQFYLATGSTAAEPLVTLTGHSLGEHAVQIFFLLSGLLVAQSFDRSAGIVSFTTGRVLRIFPALIVCVLLTSLVLGPLVTRLTISDYFADPGLIGYIARTLSLSTGAAPLPGVFAGLPAPNLVNMSLWTLKYEVLCYAGLALAGLAGLFRVRWRWVAAMAVALFAALVFIEEPKSAGAYTSLENIRYFAVYFAVGTLAYLIRDRLVLSAWGVGALFAFFSAALGSHAGEISTALFLGYTTLYLSQFAYGPLRDLTNRYDLSFGIYIYACPLQQALIGLYSGLSIAAGMAAATALVLPIALLSWVLIERPALAQRSAWTRRIEAMLPAFGRTVQRDIDGPSLAARMSRSR